MPGLGHELDIFNETEAAGVEIYRPAPHGPRVDAGRARYRTDPPRQDLAKRLAGEGYMVMHVNDARYGTKVVRKW